MAFKELLRILHEKAYVGRQDVFLLKLLKKSVSKPEIIKLSPSTVKGYFQGNNITELAVLLNDANFSVELLANYVLEELCELSHKDSPTYNARYGDKLYKDILYEKAKLYYDDIQYEKMSEWICIYILSKTLGTKDYW